MIKEPTIISLLRLDRRGVPPQKLNGHVTMEAKDQVLPWESSRHKHGETEVIIIPVRQLGPAVVAVVARVAAQAKAKVVRRANRRRVQRLILDNMMLEAT